MILFAEHQSVPVSAALQWVSNPVDELHLLFVATKLNMLLRITFQVIFPRLGRRKHTAFKVDVPICVLFPNYSNKEVQIIIEMQNASLL